MNRIDQLKTADAKGDLAEVMRVLRELLNENFIGYVGKTTEGFRNFLKGGVQC